MNSKPTEDEHDAQVDSLIDYFHRIGQVRIAREINNEHFARKISELEAERRLHQLDDAVLQMRLDRFVEDQISIQSATFDKASSYNNIVLTLGYAGFFAIWNMVATHLSFVTNAWIGSLLGLSLLLFIIWTLISSVMMTRQIAERATILGQEFSTQRDFFAAVQEADFSAQKRYFALQKYWPWIFSTTASTGLLAGLILLANLLSVIVGFEWTSVVEYVPPE